MGMIGYLKQLTPAQLEELLQHPVDIDEFYEIGIPPLSMDKLWHGLHFVLTGTDYNDYGDNILGKIILSDKILQWMTEAELGQYVLSYVTVEEVQKIAQELLKISEQDFRNKYDPEALKDNDIYPVILWDRPGEKESLVNLYSAVRDYYLDAARAGNAMLCDIS